MSNLQRHKDCPMRSKIGNCLAMGGFCTSVSEEICEALQNAYTKGRHSIKVSEDDDTSLCATRKCKWYNADERVCESPNDMTSKQCDYDWESEDELKGYDKVDKRFGEDAISRASLIKSFLADCECDSREEAGAVTLKLEDMLELIEDAPNVIPQVPNEDAISREHLKSFEYINKGDFNSVETIREWIDNAPSVIPQMPNEDAISREYMLRALNGYGKDWQEDCEIAETIRNAPSVVPTEKMGKWIRVSGYATPGGIKDE